MGLCYFVTEWVPVVYVAAADSRRLRGYCCLLRAACISPRAPCKAFAELIRATDTS